MAKKFNETGLCFPEDHYMADISKKLATTVQMVEDGAYFIINRPRQYGKTTMLYSLKEALLKTGRYLVFNISFEGIGDRIFQNETLFAQGFIDLLVRYIKRTSPELALQLKAEVTKLVDLMDLSDFISDFVEKQDKKVVILIDEVDKSSNNDLFIHFLGLLRNKYLERKSAGTFHSVVLAGVHDVKSLKLKLRPDGERQYNSPWNIATVFAVDMTLQPSEIATMLEDYMQERGVKMDIPKIAERLYFYTSGYPYLVSKLCKLIDDTILPKKTTQDWTEEDVYKAFRLILEEQWNPNFDTVFKNLETYPDLNQLVYEMVIEGNIKPFNFNEPVINLGILHGIFKKSDDGYVIIHNRIYRELIAEMFVAKWNVNQKNANLVFSDYDMRGEYRLPNNGLNMERILTNFQKFMREQYSEKDHTFIERSGRLVFLAFLKPLLNGAGYDFKEPQISDERRLDLVVTYNTHKYIAEMKMWYGEAAHQKGLMQLADYLDRQGLDTGFLVIFDNAKKKLWTKDWIDVNGKRIFWVRV
jgi:AAA-like domain